MDGPFASAVTAWSWCSKNEMASGALGAAEGLLLHAAINILLSLTKDARSKYLRNIVPKYLSVVPVKINSKRLTW